MTRQFTAYTKDYQEKCFTTWYSSNRPTLAVLHDALPVDEHGRIPDVKLIRRWRNELGWDMRADELDVRAIELVDNTLVNQKAMMLQEHARMAQELMQAGMAYIKENPDFDSHSSAVSAVIRGAELERESRGIGELITKMSKMGEEELKKEIMARLARASDAGQIIDAEEDGELDNTDTNQ